MFTGGINFVKSQRNKRLMVHVNKKGEVIAKVPHRLSIASAKEILSKQADFVEKFVQKQLNKLAKKTTTIDLFATYNILDKIVAFSPQHDLFSVPFLQSSQPIDITIQHNDSNIKEQFLHIISQLAKPILTERCSFLAKEHNIIYNKISIKLVKTI
jgi:predicted metal-dependent hydrolase